MAVAGLATTRPREVEISRWLWIASAGLGAVRSLIGFADRNRLIDQLRQSSPGLSQDAIDSTINTTVVLGLFVVVIVLGGYALVSTKMAAGRRWARIVLTVFGAGGVLFGVLGMIAAASGLPEMFGLQVSALDLVLSGIGMVMDTTALILMFRPAANAYFAGAYRGVNR